MIRFAVANQKTSVVKLRREKGRRRLFSFKISSRFFPKKRTYKGDKTKTRIIITKKMASMGDDQEENIEMWKIKKVYAHTYIYIFVFVDLFFYGKKSVVFLGLVFDDDDDDDDERESPEMMWSLFVLSLSLSLSLFECASALTPRARYEAFE